MNLKQLIFLFILITGILVSYNTKALAILGNSTEQNELIYGQPGNIPKYHYKGAKDVIIYKKDNLIITVVYRNNISILENISYALAVKPETAKQDIQDFILPDKSEKASFSSSMPFAEGYFKEDIYKNGIKTKTIYNNDGNATEVISSKTMNNQISKENDL